MTSPREEDVEEIYITLFLVMDNLKELFEHWKMISRQHSFMPLKMSQ